MSRDASEGGKRGKSCDTERAHSSRSAPPRSLSIEVIGAPVDLGQSRPGVDMGPSALRFPDLGKSLVAELKKLGHDVIDSGDVDRIKHRAQLPDLPAPKISTEPSEQEKIRYFNFILPHVAEACRAIGARVEQAAANGRIPLTLGGDHSVAIGSVAGMSRHFRKQGGKIGVLWVDAHADMNTPDISPTGNIHGMPLACCIGKGPRELTGIFDYAPKADPRNVALVGIRDLDEPEKRLVIESGVHAFTMRDIDECGLDEIMAQAIARATDGADGFHLSLDMDFLDPMFAPGVGTPVPGGATFREAHLAMEIIADSGKMRSMDIVEVNPVLDEANRTAKLALHLAQSALGRRIL
jgi:arginase